MSKKKAQRTAEIKPFMGRKCPICGKPASQQHRPFCSKRCADLDLGQWLNEGYRVPTDEEAELDYPPVDPEV